MWKSRKSFHGVAIDKTEGIENKRRKNKEENLNRFFVFIHIFRANVIEAIHSVSTFLFSCQYLSYWSVVTCFSSFNTISLNYKSLPNCFIMPFLVHGGYQFSFFITNTRKFIHICSSFFFSGDDWHYSFINKSNICFFIRWKRRRKKNKGKKRETKNNFIWAKYNILMSLPRRAVYTSGDVYIIYLVQVNKINSRIACVWFNCPPVVWPIQMGEVNLIKFYKQMIESLPIWIRNWKTEH